MRFVCMILMALVALAGGCKKEPEHPPTQQEFEKAIADTAAAYKEAPSQVEKEEAVGARKAFLEKAVENPVFEEWICKLDQVREMPMTPLPRKLYIVKVRCGDMILQNILRGGRHGAAPPFGAIEENDPVYMGVRLLSIRNRVRISGTFIKDEEKGGILEESFNESISMELPHFGVVFDSIRSAHK